MTSSHNAAPDPTRRRILFVAEALTLAHVSRLYVLANTLDPARYEIHFAAPRTSAANVVLRDAPFRTWVVKSISEELFQRRLRRGLPLWTLDELEVAVDSDRQLLREVQPELVISDMRVSMSTSASLLGVRHASVVNAQWSRYAASMRESPPETVLSPYVPWLTPRYFALVRPIGSWLYMRPINRLRRRHGLESFGWRTSRAFHGGDDVLYLDAPGIVNMRGQLPANHHFVGPAMWSPAAPLPPWWGELQPDDPVIYVSLGSTGKLGALPTILRALRDTRYRVAVAVGGRSTVLEVPSNVHVSPFLPGDVLARRSTVVIGNGGIPGTYQALAEARPVLGIPQNVDQHRSMAAIKHLGATLCLRSDWLSVRSIRRAVDRLAEEPEFARAAAGAAEMISAYPSSTWFPRYVESATGS